MSSSREGDGYDAFLSYSRAADGRLAPALQAALVSIGKPWHARRALRVFRDASSLSASPELWPTIVRALERSRYFVLLASPDAARSTWVEKEVEWWREHRERATLLIALTDGHLLWDAVAGDFSSSSALPPSARGWYLAEPLWVDLRWARETEHLSTRNPRFLDDAASLAAPIRGVEKDALVGEDVRQHRLTIRLARVAAVTLCALLIAAIAGGVLAEVQRRAAVDQRREAVRQAREATSVALAVAAQSVLASRPEVSLLLGLEAYRSSPRVEARSSVLAATVAARDPGVRAILHGHSAPVESVAMSPDGETMVSGGDDRTIRLWDIRSRKQIGRPLTGHTDRVNDVAFSDDGRTVASASSDGTIRLWDARTRTQVGRALVARASRGALTFPGGMQAVAFSPDGRTLAAAGDDATIRLWDVQAGSQIGQPLLGHQSAVNAVAFSPDGAQLASASRDGTVRLWGVRSRRSIGPAIATHADIVESVAFGRDGRTLAAAGDDKMVRLFDVRTREQIGRALRGHTDSIASVAFGPDGRTLASAGLDKTVRVWDTRTHAQVGAALTGHTDVVGDVAFSRDGRTLASAGNDETIRLWDVPTSEAPGAKPPDEPFERAALTRDSRIAAFASYGGRIRLRDVRTNAPAGSLRNRVGVQDMTFSPDGRRLAVAGADKVIRLWDRREHVTVGAPMRLADTVESIAFSPDGRTLASGGDDETVRLWDVRTGKPVGRPLAGRRTTRREPYGNPVLAVRFDHTGRVLAVGRRDGSVQLWDVRDGKPIGSPMTGHTLPVIAIAFSGDGRLLASAGDDEEIRLWDVRTRKRLGPPLAARAGVIEDLLFSRDAHTLVAAHDDGSVVLWDVPSHSRLGRPVTGTGGAILALALSADGRAVATAAEDSTTRLWTGLLWAGAAELRSAVCRLVGSGLSRTEWARFAAGVSFRRSCP